MSWINIHLIPDDDPLDEIDTDKIKSALNSRDSEIVKQQLLKIIEWSINDAAAALLRKIGIFPELLKLLNVENEEIIELTSSTMAYLSGRSGAGEFTRTWNFALTYQDSNQTNNNDTKKESISIWEPTYASGAGLGWKTWNSASVLVEWFCRHPEHFLGKEFIEIGCGTGLCGIFCSKFGATQVTMSDYNEIVLQAATRNISSNRVSATTKKLDWNRLEQEHFEDKNKYSNIIGSDVVYDSDHVEAVQKVIVHLLDFDPSSRAYLCLAPRPEVQYFIEKMHSNPDLEPEMEEKIVYIDKEGIQFEHVVLIYKRRTPQNKLVEMNN